MHCDFLTVTVPDTDASAVRGSLLDLGAAAGGVIETPDLLRVGHGTLRMRDHSRGFTSFGVSGSALETLRGAMLLPDLLHVIGSVPHRVTRLDVAHDISRPAPPVLARLLREARAGDVSLTRKALRPANVRFIDAYNHHTPGTRTGSLYLGARSSEVRAIIYDKQNERLDKGFPDPGPLTRFELTVTGKLSPSLRDVVEPEPMYWKFMSGVLPPPANCPDWDGQASGFELPPPVAHLPYALLKRKVEDSPDIQHALDLASRLGPHGLDILISLIRQRAQSTPIATTDSEVG